MEYSIVWFRNDLRVDDHEPLVRAAASGLPVIALYCFDPRQFGQTSFGFPKTGAHRAKFLMESVRDLRQSLQKLGVNLIVRMDKPEEVLKELSETMTIKNIYYHDEIGSEERSVEKYVKESCPNVTFYSYEGHNLIHPNDLPFSVANLPDIFTQFRKQVERRLFVRDAFPVPSFSQQVEIEEGQLPTLQDLGLQEVQEASAFFGGETEGKKRLQHYFFEADCLKQYKETRNGMLERDDSSKFSPYLAHGCLSPRTIYWAIKRYETERVANDSTYWLFFELLWRDYFYLVHKKYGNRLFQQGGLDDVKLSWSTDEKWMEAWLNGQTGYPLVDANMLELKQIGFMSNRGRQNVASFLTKNLGIDWRVGAEWFESTLIDYDVSSNYGNWCYVAGVGNDARVFRVFNVVKQGKDYDAKGLYAKYWLPVLQHVPAHRVYDVFKLSQEEQENYQLRLGMDYPNPVVDLFASAEAQKLKYNKAIKVK